MTVNVAELDPAGTVTVGGTVTGLSPDSDTTAPPAGAPLLNVTMPLTESPPTTVAVLSEIDTSAAPPTVSVAVLLPPLIDAVMVTVPAEIVVTVNTALDEPAATVTTVGTVAMAVLLLDSETLAPPVGAAADSVTVPCTVVPAAVLAALSATPARACVVG
jgi:hypothetical protein